jgi:Bacterial Ig domain
MRRLMPVCLLFALAACGGSDGSTPTTPTTPTTPQANRAPVISSASVTPTFGIADITPFNFAAIASDPDGDTLSYSWNAAGNTAAAASPPPLVFSSPGGNGSATITVTDGRGGTASSSVNFIVGSMSGRWVGTMPGFALSYNFIQASPGTLTATFTATGAVGVTGNLDPASANTINGAGHVTFRSKVTSVGVQDYTITGDMDNTGTRFVGSVTGSGLSGPVVLVKQ